MTGTPPSPFVVGLTCRCPRCGKGHLFARWGSLTPKDKCEACGLDYDFIESGDGPAVFAILILGFVVLGGALIAEFKFGVPIWGHLLLWGILTPLLAIGLLKVLKSTLAALQLHYAARPAGGGDVKGPDA
ncbi:MAG: DUF983 domain-containing protein [Hyphomicrobiaceae bacterium]